MLTAALIQVLVVALTLAAAGGGAALPACCGQAHVLPGAAECSSVTVAPAVSQRPRASGASRCIRAEATDGCAATPVRDGRAPMPPPMA